MEKLSYKHINMLMAVVGLLLGASCASDDNLNELLSADNRVEVYFSLQAPEPVEVAVTRNTTDVERTIRTARLMIFDKEGICFYNEPLDENPTTNYNARIIGVPVQSDEEKYKNCTAWIVANVALWDQIASDSELNLNNISNLDDLKAKFGHIQISQSNPAYRQWIAMTGSVQQVDMTQPGNMGNPLVVKMERVLAKVNFQINVEGNFSFYFNNWYLENIPCYSYLLPRAEGEDYYDINKDSNNKSFFYPEPEFTNNYTTQTVKQWFGSGTSSSTTSTYSFYTYENRRGGRGEIDWDNMSGEAGDYAGLDGNVTDTDGDDPKFKTLYAPANATFLVITGMIRQRSGDTGEVQDTQSFAYRIALGANNYDDYNLNRNSEYTYNINIKGVTYDDVTVDVFDSRVHKAYALLIDAPSLDRVDCHYDKRHIDITSSRGELTLQLFKNREDAEAGTNPLDTDNCPFILSLTDTYDYELVEQKQTEITLLSNANDKEEMNRHIFLYAKENLTTEAKTAELKITHKPEQGSSVVVIEPEYRYYTVSQAGLIPIDVEINGQIVHLGVESYEECAMRIDPREDHELKGLQWGWSGTEIFTPRTDFSDKTYDLTSRTDGIGNTKKLISFEIEGKTTTVAFDGVDVNSLYNNYAARYCYNKNRRKNDGIVIEEFVKWYLPAIDELIPLTASIGISGMQNIGYWSSSVPTYKEATSKPSWWPEWEQVLWFIVQSIISNLNSEYYYSKVAQAANNGEEERETITQGGEWYPRRKIAKSVRAVRIMPE